jgi:hypothetical protein
VKINLITAPDIVYNNAYSILMICPTDGLKLELQSHLSEFDIDVNIYMANANDHVDIKWLLSISKWADIVIFDIDNSPTQVQELRSYLISLSNVFWLTNHEYLYYNILSTNREYNLDFLQQKLGGYIEKKQRTAD